MNAKEVCDKADLENARDLIRRIEGKLKEALGEAGEGSSIIENLTILISQRDNAYNEVEGKKADLSTCGFCGKKNIKRVQFGWCQECVTREQERMR